jgi:DUF1680 family protein
VNRVSRRTLLGAALAGATLPLAWREAAALAVSGGSLRASPFAPGRVSLGDGAAARAHDVNRRHLLALDPDRLLHMFRVTAGLPSDAAPLGGWEAPTNELRGHFTGHYLSALARLAGDGDAEARGRAADMVVELARCQEALGNGYLGAFPEELFDRLRAGQPAWAPFYTLHKLMAGLLDAHRFAAATGAWPVLLGMARWTERWVQPLGTEAMARVLEREYGGMNDVLYEMAAVSGERRWRELGARFERARILAPLAAGRDELEGLHANTTIPQIVGAARGYALGGERERRDAASYFWHTVTERRAYVTGGSSNGESWSAPPGRLAHELSGYTQECCVTYNLMKLTRLLFGWTGDPRVADYYERAWYNGILGVQHPADGQKLYYVPLESGYWKLFGTPLADFWCCCGSMAEAFASLADGIYFHDGDDLFVNLYVPSQVDFRERGVRVLQDTRFPDEERVRLRIECAQPVRFRLRLRVPAWAEGAHARLDGRPLEALAAAPGYLVIDRLWRHGETVELTLPLALRVESMPDDAGLGAVCYGPLVLAARLGTDGLTPAVLRAPPTAPRTVPEYPAGPVAVPVLAVEPGAPVDWLERVPGPTLAFRTRTGLPPLAFMPLNALFDERYAVYLRLTGGSA